MKNWVVGFLGLVSVSAFASTEASLNYSCEMDGTTLTGTVSIDSDMVLGQASCMYFGSDNPTLCWRFERHDRIHNIYLALRFDKDLNSWIEDNFIELGNIPYAEGATGTTTIKRGMFRADRKLNCTFSAVNWKHEE